MVRRQKELLVYLPPVVRTMYPASGAFCPALVGACWEWFPSWLPVQLSQRLWRAARSPWAQGGHGTCCATETDLELWLAEGIFLDFCPKKFRVSRLGIKGEGFSHRNERPGIGSQNVFWRCRVGYGHLRAVTDCSLQICVCFLLRDPSPSGPRAFGFRPSVSGISLFISSLPT